MNSLWPSRSSSETPSSAPSQGQTLEEAAGTGIADSPGDPPDGSTSVPAAGPVRPQLQRNTQQPTPPPPAVPPPPTQFAPPPPGNTGVAGSQPPDSLSLAQLRRIVAEFPRTEPIAYDYVYEDTGPIEEEIDEWFTYSFFQWVRLNATQRHYVSLRKQVLGEGEEGMSDPLDSLVAEALRRISLDEDGSPKDEAIGALVYMTLGRWVETATAAVLPGKADTKVKCVATTAQLTAMKQASRLIGKCGGIPVIWQTMRRAFEPFWKDEIQQATTQQLQALVDELLNPMTIMYILIQETLSDPVDLASVREQLLALDPGLVDFMLHATVKLRWDETGALPQTQVFLLFWKSLLLTFGGTEEIIATKHATRESEDGGKDKNLIIASPLDYHAFRQEVTSKYPAYIPPQCVVPLEADQTSILPQMPNHPSRSNGQNGILSAPSNQSGGASILNQPVHIATPAPSPPPSPAVGGKGGKKQNYQTNQNFPFMYPPLDASSNSAGGKGAAGLQDLLVGRKWEGSDIPASILEAGKLFSERVRMSRATRQLWEEREKFLKFERGWDEVHEDIIEELDLSSLTLEEREELGLEKPKSKPESTASASSGIDLGPRPNTVDQQTKYRLEAVEKFYNESLPHLQSLVIVLLKAVIAIASNLVAPGPNGQQHPGVAGQNGLRVNGGQGAAKGLGALNNMNGIGKGDIMSPLDIEADEGRSREIAAKAVTGITVLLLKWFKLSHILKFEYFTQLLLDANYLPLVLKLFALQDVQQVVESKTDRIESSFFYFSGFHAGATAAQPTQGIEEDDEDESEDEAAPPPIKRRRSPQQQFPQEGDGASQGAQGMTRPEVDELGYPVNPLPKEPITEFSRRNFFSLINYLRVMQKICKNKAHRNLLLVHYKSSNILRKSLKVPQQELRLYTLKLFKNQVPYCGRKWRQSNMRVITAVYLHCRPELRDEWLAGCDVEVAVDESLPLEQALRSLTHWFNVHRYPDKMAAEVREALKEEQDFFVRELEKMELTWADMDGDERSVNLEWEHEGPWG
ncbi:N1221-domain-containing protein [Thozetella sp. PMI_491]|nr:N1221-domain-containing protein [Thozetella sp. PMI_491]